MLEDAAYRRMLDLYYASEKPLPKNRDGLYRLVRAKSPEEKLAVDVILGEFFTETKRGWSQKRVEIEISKARVRTQVAQENGKKGGRPITQREPSNNPAGLQPETQVKAPNNQKPLTNNQNQKESRAPRSQGSRLPPGWFPSEPLKAWAVKERADLDVMTVIAKFRDYWLAVPGGKGLKLDWDATFRNWVRGEKAGNKSTQIDYDALAARIEEEDRKNAVL